MASESHSHRFNRQNPYLSLYGDKWKEEAAKTPAMRKVVNIRDLVASPSLSTSSLLPISSVVLSMRTESGSMAGCLGSVILPCSALVVARTLEGEQTVVRVAR